MNEPSDPAARPEGRGEEVVLSLISHTNVGKTALARTLLRRDIGEVADTAHVTVVPEAHPLVECEGATAMLWDTPGFGANLAKLAKRLRSSDNPVGWILHQVWDRARDRSLWCSQEAVRNIRDEADLVLYLVDASQPPAGLGYVDLEIEVIEWIGKPVMVLLNQTGQPDAERDRLAETEWRLRLERHPAVKRIATLDAFTRCWTEEHLVLEAAASILEGPKAKAASRLAAALARRNREVFDQSVDVLADFALASLTDAEPLPSPTLRDRLQRLLVSRERNRELEQAQQRMYSRLAGSTAEAVNRLIQLNGLDGESRKRIEADGKLHYDVKRKVDEPFGAVVGGTASGLVGGLAADLTAGGLTFGGGAVVGMLLGGGASYALVRGYNLVRTGTDRVRWTQAHFLDQMEVVLLFYLAVAHFGRGRGKWRDSEANPARFQELVKAEIQSRHEDWAKLWKKGGPDGEREALRRRLRGLLRGCLAASLARLHPEAAALLGAD